MNGTESLVEFIYLACQGPSTLSMVSQRFNLIQRADKIKPDGSRDPPSRTLQLQLDKVRYLYGHWLVAKYCGAIKS